MGLHVIEICETDGIRKEIIHPKADARSTHEFFEICKVGGWKFSNIYRLNGTIEIRGELKQHGQSLHRVGYFHPAEQSQKTSSHEFRTRKHKRKSLIQK